MLGAGWRGHESLALLRGDGVELGPGQLDATGGDDLRAIEHRAGIELARLAETAQERREARASDLADQAAQRWTFGQHARMRERVLGHASDLLTRIRAGELHVQLLLAVGEAAQHVDREIGNARGDEQHDEDVTRREPPAEAVALHRRRYPERSTSVLMISLTTASSDNMEATAKAPT